MTKLSEALRGAADRAPVNDLSVSTDMAARRVGRQRGLRGAANGLVGIGAVTVLAVGIMAPTFGGPGGADAGTERVQAGADGGDEASAFAEDSAGTMLAGGCGSYLDYTGWGDPTVDLDARVAGLDPDAGEVTEFDGGQTLDLEVIITALEDVNLASSGPQVSILWEGMLVGELMISDTAMDEVVLDEGGTLVNETQVSLANCWDGVPLPPGTYELVVAQAFYPNGERKEPTFAPMPEPSVAPRVDPNAPVTNTPGDMGGGTEAIEPMPEPLLNDFQVVAPTVPLVIAGEVPDDPFAEYLPQPVELPDNYLTPQVARDLYQESLTSEAWDMAAGTQRWVLQSGAGEEYTEESWQRRYFGCSYDGVEGVGFPAESSEMDLFEVDASVPSSISVSYGWVVDGNPRVDLTVTNTSEYALPGFHGQPSAELYLVRDGRVVAEAYPSQLRPYGGDDVIFDDGREAIEPSYGIDFGLLDSGAALEGEYLWRDVSGCSTESGGQRPLEPGTYTLLNTQGIYVTDGVEFGYGYDEEFDARAQEEGLDSMIAPAPVQSDYVELRVWTSLGQVNVTSSTP